jgi:hypothetical protein
MLRNRWFTLLIGTASVLVVALTAREVFATVAITSQPEAISGCASLPSRYTIHTAYVKEAGISVPYTEAGPTGVDGGLLELMSAYRNCP